MKTFLTKSAARPRTRALTTYDAGSGRWALEPIRVHFGGGAVHYCSIDGSFDLKRLAETFSDRLVRTQFRRRDDPERGDGYWHELTIRMDDQVMVAVDEDSAGVYAATPELARRTADGLRRTFSRTRGAIRPTFQIVKKSDCGIDTEAVGLDDTSDPRAEELALHYGDDFPAWHATFLERLRARRTGLSVFDGPPGTGKTSYLRRLVAELRESHRFYFLASANLRLLRDPEFVDFWATERRSHEQSAMVVILEDAEIALMPRGADNRQEVSLLLNITDGILGEFLKLQVICTVNCALKELDAALLRPGRLMAHRHFGRLTVGQAQRLAESLGRGLPAAADYTLAEVFSGELDRQNRERRSIGFGR